MDETTERVQELTRMADHYLSQAELQLLATLKHSTKGDYDDALASARLAALGYETVLAIRDEIIQLVPPPDADAMEGKPEKKSAESAA